MSRKHKKQIRQTRGSFEPLPPSKARQKAKLTWQAYEAAQAAFLRSPEYLAAKAKRDAEYAEIQERRRIEKLMKGSENAPAMTEELLELFGLSADTST